MDCKCGKVVWYDGKCKACFEKSRKHENIVFYIEKLIKDYDEDFKKDTCYYTEEILIKKLKKILGGNL
jgi:hypothetical protein